MPIDKVIDVIGVPIDLGAGRRGVDMGPSAMRIADLDPKLRALGLQVHDCGDMAVTIPETQDSGERTLRFKPAILSTCEALAERVAESHASGCFPLVLGGDHSIAIGTIAGSSNHFATGGESIGVIWFDAHGDFNTPETTPSGNIHGMSLAVSAGLGDADLCNIGGRAPKVHPRNVVHIGTRELDTQEKENIKRSGVTIFTMRDLDERGLRRVMEDALAVAGHDTAGVHLSFDLDVVDPQFAPGTGTPVPGGISYREAHLAMEMVGDGARVLSMDVVEVNPVLDVANKTARLAVELIQSLMGKRIV